MECEKNQILLEAPHRNPNISFNLDDFEIDVIGNWGVFPP